MLISCDKCAGLTLVEVLVALLVLSIGVFSLAIAGSQSMRLAGESNYYSIASAAGGDLLDIQRRLISHHPNLMSSAGFSTGQLLSVGTACLLGPCAPADLQAYLQNSWQCSLAADGCSEVEGLQALPEFEAELLVDNASGELRLNMDWRVKNQLRNLELESRVQ